jgi:glucokinase
MACNCSITLTSLSGVGIGCSGIIDSSRGIVLYSTNLRWSNFDIAAQLSAELGLPVRLTNDANAAALGEARYGAAAGYKDSIFVTLGTGVGGGIVADGALFEGGRGCGVEIGHQITVQGGTLCACGLYGCWEQYASATALIASTKAAMRTHPLSLLNSVSLDTVDGKLVLQYCDSDAAAAEVVASYIEHLAVGVLNLINIFRPQVIIIGGGLSAQGPALIDRLRAAVGQRYYGGKLGPQVTIKQACLQNAAGVIGAACLCG